MFSVDCIAFMTVLVLALQFWTTSAVKSTNAKKQGAHSVDILMRLAHLSENHSLTLGRYKENLEGLMSFTAVPIHLHLIIPKDSFELADAMIADINQTTQTNMQVTKYDLLQFTSELSSMAKTDFGQDPDFSQMLAERMPTLLFPFKFPHLKKLIVIENRLTIRADIAELNSHFRHFNDDQVIGVALQQVPKYRHSFAMYEKYNPASGLGQPARPGFNTALLLLDLHRMRHSITLNAFLHYPSLRWLVHKYWFTKENNPVITQEDVFTLMGFEHAELFYILPCGWNRQLDVFAYSQSEAKDYNQCNGKIGGENFQE